MASLSVDHKVTSYLKWVTTHQFFKDEIGQKRKYYSAWRKVSTKYIIIVVAAIISIVGHGLQVEIHEFLLLMISISALEWELLS